ncbi:hypothetical protein BBJ28_00018121 [Nothophytophthora sp. Chile5]|nr:hypothetical protein BBJ28_00018121 [Nothophytophthora sp. Chile5]
MTILATTFDDRATLEKAIDACSSRVRSLQERMRSGSDEDEAEDEVVSMEDVAQEVKKLVGLRKELQVWKIKEEEEEEEEEEEAEAARLAAEKEEQEQTSDNQNGDDTEDSWVRVGEKEPESPEQEVDVVADAAAEAEEALTQRATRVAAWLVAADARLTALETAAVKMERTKRAVAFLKRQEEATKAVEAAQPVEEAVAGTLPVVSEKKPKVKKAKAQKSAVQEPAKTAETTASATNVELERHVQEVATLTAELAAERVKAEKAVRVNQQLQKSEQSLRDAQIKLESSMTTLTEANAELLAKLQTARDTDVSLRDELVKVQATLTELQEDQDSKETHLGKLWKTIEDLQLVNKQLTDKNAELDAETKAMRAETEKTLAEYAGHESKNDEAAAELAAAKAELETSLTATLALKTEVEELRAHGAALANDVRVAESKSSQSEERLLTLEKELEAAKQSADDALAGQGALRTESQDAERAHAQEKYQFTARIAELESSEAERNGNADDLKAELEKATTALKTARADKQESERQLLAMKDEVVRLTLSSEKAVDQASGNDSQLKKLKADLDSRKTELAATTAQIDALTSQRTNAEAQLQDLRGVAATQEEMLKKARTSLLEANEELKDARAHTLKWKNSAQAAKTLMNAKIADAESASKQLKKARAEAATANSTRSQLTNSLETREKKINKTKQELVVVRERLTKALEVEEAKSEVMKQTHATQVTQLRESSQQAVALLDGQVQSYRMMLVILLPILIAVVFYAITK